MVSYDAVSPDARKLTGAGLTFVFTKSFLRTRVLAVHATAVPVGVVVCEDLWFPEPLDATVAACARTPEAGMLDVMRREALKLLEQ